MNIPYCILKDQRAISAKAYEYHQILGKKLYSSSKKIKINSKASAITNNYSKKKIFKWLFSLLKICSIYNDWFTSILFQLLTYDEYDNNLIFSPRRTYENFYKKIEPSFDDEKYDYQQDVDVLENFGENFSNFFQGTKSDKKIFSDAQAHKVRIREKDFLKELRFITINKYNDTITLSSELLESKQKLQEYFDTFSNCKIFSENIVWIKAKKDSNIFNFSFPNWVNNFKYFTIPQLIVICFEQIISIYYQIYLLDGNVPEFEIDTKINDILNMNKNIENYLGKELSIEDKIFNINSINKEINNEKNKDSLRYYEKISEFIYEIAFERKRSNFFYDESSNIHDINRTVSTLAKEYKNNISTFVNIISFVEASLAFKIENIIYNIIYQQISYLCSQNNIDELCMNVDIKPKKKNKKKRNNNKKNNMNENRIDINYKNNEEENNINVNIGLEAKKENYNNINNDNNNNDNYSEENDCDNLNNNLYSINSVEKNNINNSYDYEENETYFSTEKKNEELPNKGKEYVIEMKYLNENGKEIKNEEEEKEKEEEKEEKKEKKEKKEEEKEKEINDNNDLLKELKEMDLKEKKKKKKKRKNKKKNINDNNNNKEEIKEQEKQKEEVIIKDKIEENIHESNDNKIEDKKEEKEEKKEKEEKEEKEENSLGNINQKFEEIKIENDTKENNSSVKINLKEENNNNNNNNKKKDKEFFLYPIHKKKKEKKNKLNKNNQEKNSKNSNSKSKSKEILNEFDKEKEKTKDNFISEKNSDKNIISIISTDSKTKKDENKNNIFIQQKTNEIALEGKKVNEKKDDNNPNNADYLTEDSKNQIVNPNNPIINNYIIIEKDSHKVKSLFNDGFHLNMNNIFISPKSFYPSLVSNFNYSVPYQHGPNYYMKEQSEIFKDLSKEILLHEEKVNNNLNLLSQYKEDILNNIKKYIEKILIENNFEAKLINYGSYETKLSIEISDIDILIKFCKNNPDNDINNINSLNHINEIIALLYNKINNDKKDLNILQINAIYTASVPVLKIKFDLKGIIPSEIKASIQNNYLFNFEEDILQLNFDFTFIEVSNINEDKYIPSLEIVSYIKKIMNNYIEIKPILLFLKRYMKINKLNSSFHGGLSSYSLFLLVYGYIKSFNISGLSVGNYLYGFLDFYSNFNFGIHSINVSFNNPFVVLNELHEAGIMLVDPITKLNVAKSTFRVDQIKSVLMKGVIIIRNIIYQKMIGNKSFNYENSKNIFLDELFKNKNDTIIDSIGNHLSNQNSFGK